jgi:hypothetical protein
MPQQMPWDSDPVVGTAAPASAPGVIYGRPKTPDPLETARYDLAVQADARSARTEQRMGEAEKRQADNEAHTRYMEMHRPLDTTTQQNLDEKVGLFSGYDRQIRGFKDAYGGAGAGIENFAQGYLPVGDEGQRQWWSDFKAQDAVVRNKLFGASLSDSEKAAFAETTVSPNMRPEEIKRNLAARAKLAKAALDRFVSSVRANHYDPAPIDAVVGEYGAPGWVNPFDSTPDGAGKSKDTAPKLTPDQYDAQVGRMIREGRSADDILKFAADNGFTITNPDAVKAATNGSPYKMDTASDGVGRQIGLGVGGIVQAGGDLLGLVGNPVNSLINATGIPQALIGSQLSTDLGATTREGLGLPTPQNDSERLADAANRTAASALGGVGIARGVTSALSSFAGGGGGGGGTRSLAQYVAEKVGANPGIDTAAGAGSGGAGEIARQRGAGPGGQLVASALGGFGGVAGSAGARALVAERTPNALLTAARNQGVDLLPADVGGVTTRRLTSAAAQGPLSAGPIVARAQAGQSQMRDAVARTAGQVGDTLPVDEAGTAISRAGRLYSAQSSAKGGALYQRAEKMAGDVKVQAKSAIDQIDSELARLNETADVNQPLISELNKFRASLASGNGLSIQGVRDVRSLAGMASYNDALRATPAKAVFARVTDAISNDINNGLVEAGRGNAGRAFKTADAYWKNRVEQIDQVLEPVIGKNKSGEDVMSAVESMAQGRRGGVDRLGKLMRLLPDQERGDVQATIIDRMGRASNGQQGVEGNTFSASTFLTNWNKMSAKGRAELFPHGEVRKNLTEIATLADNMKQAQRYANHSNTSGGIAGQVMLSGGVGWLGGPKGVILASAAQFLSGKALASPRLVNWLAKVPTNPTPAYLDRLTVIAAREPAIAQDIGALQRALAGANDNIPQAGAAITSPNSGPDQNQ